MRKLPEGVEYHVRSGEEGNFAFYLNGTTREVTLSGVKGRDLVTDTEIEDSLTLPGYGVAVVHFV